MSKSTKMKNYFNLDWIVGLILHIFVGWILSPVSRLLRGKILSGILAIFLFFIFFWVDLVSIIVNKDIVWLDF